MPEDLTTTTRVFIFVSQIMEIKIKYNNRNMEISIILLFITGFFMSLYNIVNF